MCLAGELVRFKLITMMRSTWKLILSAAWSLTQQACGSRKSNQQKLISHQRAVLEHFESHTSLRTVTSSGNVSCTIIAKDVYLCSTPARDLYSR
mmetsp:Transcript_6217/g.13790  ORF Transcript_6217/g.13790 Transcript_6217/m.13790 type:complete len:94 (-) Transcript_6217:57-338(-)